MRIERRSLGLTLLHRRAGGRAFGYCVRQFSASIMANIDSEAYFDARMTVVGLSPAEQAAVRARGWLTLATFAFASSWTPGQADEQQFLTKVVVPVLGAEDHISAPKLRRLMFEAYTLAVSDLRSKLTRTADDPPLRMSQPERHARMQKLRNRLTGLSLTEGLEPSHKLVDTFVQMSEDDSIRYVPWEELTERSQEIHGVVKDKAVTDLVLKPDNQGFLKSSVAGSHQFADLTSDLKLKQALTRRGLAMDLAGLCSYEQHQLLVDMFLREYLRPPIDDHRSTSLEQIKRADRHVFTRLAEHTMSGIRQQAGSLPPIEVALKLIMLEPTLSYLLMQGQVARSSGKGSNKQEDPSDKAARKRKHEATMLSAQAAKAAKLAAKGGKSKGASPSPAAVSKGKGKVAALPQALIGKQALTSDGRRMCFSYNLGGCSLAADGGECTKGWHLCMESGCQQPHSCKNHV